jgi:hypothetical protein
MRELPLSTVRYIQRAQARRPSFFRDFSDGAFHMFRPGSGSRQGREFRRNARWREEVRVTCTLTYISKSEVPNSLRGGAFECQDDADLCACRGWTIDDSGPSGRLWAKPGPTIEFDFEPELDRIVEIQRIALLMGDVEFVCPKRPPSPAARGLLASPATQASVSK